jgi:hypothetical protein
MRERLAQVLEKDDEDEPMDAVVRRFWSRTTQASPTPNTGTGGLARVVDLAHARRARAHS